MNSVYKERVGMVVIARVAMVALVLLCIAPHKLEAETPALAASDGALSPAALSAADWPAIQANLAQAADYAPLVAGQVAKLTASDAAANDYFGYAVAVSEDTVIVGVPYDDDGGNFSGSAYVFERNQGGADNWGEVQKLTAGDAAINDNFGISVAISGDTVVVGAYAEDDWFGLSVAVSGDTVVVGAHQEDGGLGDPLNNAGAAYVFERNHGGGDNWGEVQKLMASDAGLTDYFGQAVSISGNIVVVGALGENGGPGDPLLAAGAAYVFERNQGGVDNWGEVQKLTASDAGQADYFG